MIASSLATMTRGGIREGQNTAASQTANLQSEVSQSQAAEMLQVSPRSVATAAKIERDAPTEVADAVKAGAMSIFGRWPPSGIGQANRLNFQPALHSKTCGKNGNSRYGIKPITYRIFALVIKTTPYRP